MQPDEVMDSIAHAFQLEDTARGYECEARMCYGDGDGAG